MNGFNIRQNMQGGPARQTNAFENSLNPQKNWTSIVVPDDVDLCFYPTRMINV